MKNDKLSRRTFIRDTSIAAAATVAAGLSADAQSSTAPPAERNLDTSKILNYDSKMGYRRLGKTNLVMSEVSLGGHWRAPWRDQSDGWWWGKFANEEVPDDVARNRTEVVSRAIDCGMNYLDITGAEECLCYGAAMKGRR